MLKLIIIIKHSSEHKVSQQTPTHQASSTTAPAHNNSLQSSNSWLYSASAMPAQVYSAVLSTVPESFAGASPVGLRVGSSGCG